jgi:preprotein translocase subunit SecY
MDRLWSRIDRRALLVTAVCIVIWRVLDQISVVDVMRLFIHNRLDLYSQPGFFAAIGPNSIRFSAYSIGYLGISPYVQVLVVMSLVPAISNRIKSLIADPRGLVRYRRWIRALALLWALAAAYGWTKLAWNAGALPENIDWSARLIICLQLTAGTAVLIMLADALDDFGLGFGYGALIFYALGFVAAEVHRIGEYLAATPDVEALYRPLAISAASTVGLTAAGVAVLLAVRRIPSPFEDERKRGARLDIRLLTSGVFRPPQLAFTVMVLPSLLANYFAQGNPQLATWFTINWGAYGATPWLDLVYLVVEATFVVLAALFVTYIDFQLRPAPPPTYPHVMRLALLGGLLLALAVIAVPVANHFLTMSAGALIPVSGADVLLVVAVILAVVRSIEGHKTVVPFTLSPTGLP